MRNFQQHRHARELQYVACLENSNSVGRAGYPAFNHEGLTGKEEMPTALFTTFFSKSVERKQLPDHDAHAR